MMKRLSLMQLSVLLHLLVLSSSSPTHAASTGIPATPRNRGGAGGGAAAVQDEDYAVDYVALPEDGADVTEVPPAYDTAHFDEAFDLNTAPVEAEETSATVELHPHDEAGQQPEEMFGTKEAFAEVMEEPRTVQPKTHEELIAEELKKREEEKKKRDDELLRREEELKLREEEEVRRREELERRKAEELLREDELKRRQEEEERRAHADRLVQEELERRKAAAEIASAASATSAALTAADTFPEDARNKRHEETMVPTTDDQSPGNLEEERKLAENLSRKEEIEIKHFEDGLAHEAAGVEQHDHEAYEHQEIARQREELIKQLEMERQKQEDEVRRQEEVRQREELERLQREQEYIIQQENRKREMEEDPHQQLRVGVDANGSAIPASASLSLLLISLLWGFAPVRV